MTDIEIEALTRNRDEWKLKAETAEKRLSDIDMSHSGSHYGDPILTKRDISLLAAYTEWVETRAKEWDKHPFHKDHANHLPHYPDWIKSRLFWRIRSGKKPLKYPPPRAYSCPWYELIEEPEREHYCFECLTIRDNECHVCQCPYDYLGTAEDGKFILGFGPYRFLGWNGPTTFTSHLRNGKTEETTRQVGWIKYTGIEEPKDE